MKKVHVLYLLSIIFLLSSCYSSKLSTKDFMPINDLSELNGRYINKKNRLSKQLNIYNHGIEVIDLHFTSKKHLMVSYIDTIGYKEIILKGKKKKNYFEISLKSTRIYIPIVFTIHHKERLRIGKDKDGKLLMHKYDYGFGNILILVGAHFDDYETTLDYYDKNIKEGLYALQVNGKWGYADKNDSLVIPPIYDYAQPFKNGIAKVARNKQWGAIDSLQNEVIPLIYDVIMDPEEEVIRVQRNGKWGLLDSLSKKEILAPQYDRIESFRNSYYDLPFYNKAEVYKDNKLGFINKQGVEVIPTEYEKIWLDVYQSSYPRYYRTKLGDKYGYVSGYGVLCKPIFEKAKKTLGRSGFDSRNDSLVEKIGKYAKVTYKGERYIFTEKGILYKYKDLGFFKGNKLVVDFDSGFYPKEE